MILETIGIIWQIIIAILILSILGLMLYVSILACIEERRKVKRKKENKDE